MLTEGQTSKGVETSVGVVEPPAPPPASVPRYAFGLAPFLAVVVQFGLVVLVVEYWHLESLSLTRLMQLAFVGFIIHHLIPLRFRLPFFAMLSLVAIVVVLGEMGPNTWLEGLTGRIPLRNF
jgi:hypothetical protein